jgi:D-alanyl-D-alanine carboxypeptidase
MAKYPKRPAGVVIGGAQNRGWGPGWPHCQGDKIRTVELKSGVKLRVRTEVSELVRLLLNECERRGYRFHGEQTGGFNCRQIFKKGKPTGRPSNHSWGLAVDLNWKLNPWQSPLKTNIPPWMVQLMWAYGFFWGGWYNGDKDAMHFEFVKTPKEASRLTVALKKALDREYEPRTRATLYRASISTRPQPVLLGDDMFNPYLVQVPGDPRIFIVTSGGVYHVKNPTHLRYLVDGGVPGQVKKISKVDLDQLLEVE